MCIRDSFRTALFIGDSLSQGFALYAPTRDVATVCAYKSTSPNQVLQNFVGQRPDGSRIEMWDDIKVQSPSNIYVLYGTNALISQSDEAFLKYYSDQMCIRDRLGPVQQTDASYTQPSASLVALPEAGRVDMSYFDDALFIGDSLTRGFQEYSSGIPNAKYAAYLGAGPKPVSYTHLVCAAPCGAVFCP